MHVLRIQPDGRLLLGGDFQQVGEVQRNRVARVVANGIPDPSFDPGVGADGPVRAIALQPDGRIVIAGDFLSVGGTSRAGIARLLEDGALDASFHPGSGANGPVRALALQPDGKILLAGDFTAVDGVARGRIARLNADGALDPSFDPGAGADGTIHALALQPDGKIVIAGAFDFYAGSLRPGITRLDEDGSRDTGFGTGTGVIGPVLSLALQTDGKILLGGDFSNFNFAVRNRIARLNATGSLDASFDPGADGTVRALAIQGDGKILVSGDFSSLGGIPRGRVGRLDGLGKVESDLGVGAGASGTVHAIVERTDGSLVAGGEFLSYGGIPRHRIVGLSSAGAVVPAFEPNPGANAAVWASTALESGQVAIGGDFTAVNGVTRNRLAVLNADGTPDPGFDPGGGPSGTVLALAVQPDGKLLVAGSFASFDGSPRGSIARVLADGALDASFQTGSGANGQVFALALQPDGRIVIAGNFTSYGGTPRNRVARLNADGTLDPTFNPGGGASNEVRALELQADGRILIGGTFIAYAGVSRIRLARINADGGLDASFVSNGANSRVRAIEVLPDGRVLIGGDFTSIGSTTRPRLARLHPTGATDFDFDPGAGPNQPVFAIEASFDGTAIVAGSFASYAGVPRGSIARVLADGSLDPAFDPGTGAASWIQTLTTLPTGQMLIGGNFANYDGFTRLRVARLSASEIYVPFCAEDGGGSACPCGNTGGEGRGCANGSGPGAALIASGSRSLSSADLVLETTGLVPALAGLYFQGTNQVNGGLGIVFGDGLRCAGGALARIQIRVADALGTSRTTVDVGAVGGASPGATRTYQLWYRDIFTSPCGPGFNLSNGIQVVWVP